METTAEKKDKKVDGTVEVKPMEEPKTTIKKRKEGEMVEVESKGPFIFDTLFKGVDWKEGIVHTDLKKNPSSLGPQLIFVDINKKSVYTYSKSSIFSCTAHTTETGICYQIQFHDIYLSTIKPSMLTIEMRYDVNTVDVRTLIDNCASIQSTQFLSVLAINLAEDPNNCNSKN
jgi:hypothetical protein